MRSWDCCEKTVQIDLPVFETRLPLHAFLHQRRPELDGSKDLHRFARKAVPRDTSDNFATLGTPVNPVFQQVAEAVLTQVMLVGAYHMRLQQKVGTYGALHLIRYETHKLGVQPLSTDALHWARVRVWDLQGPRGERNDNIRVVV